MMQMYKTQLQPFSTGFSGGMDTLFPYANRGTHVPAWDARLGRGRLRDLDDETGPPSHPPPKKRTSRIESHAKGEVFTLDRIEADGRATTSSTLLYLDGKLRDF